MLFSFITFYFVVLRVIKNNQYCSYILCIFAFALQKEKLEMQVVFKVCSFAPFKWVSFHIKAVFQCYAKIVLSVRDEGCPMKQCLLKTLKLCPFYVVLYFARNKLIGSYLTHWAPCYYSLSTL